MAYSKRTAAGRCERLALLQQWEARTQEVLDSVKGRYKRTAVQVDDVLDALVALVTARAESNELRMLWGGACESFDEEGLPMRMAYREPKWLPHRD